MKKTPLQRRTSLRDSYAAKMRAKMAAGERPAPRSGSFKAAKAPKPRKPLPKIGKRGRKRQEMNAQLNLLGITHCELRLPGCWGNRGLTWAHSKKSRFLVTDADWLHSARGCLHCHRIIEPMSHQAMFDIVSAAIAKRDAVLA